VIAISKEGWGVLRKYLITSVLVFSQGAWAMDLGGMIGELGAGARVPTVSYTGWLEPNSDSGNTFQNLGSAVIPVYSDEKDSSSLSASASDLHFDRQQTLTGTAVAVPKDIQKYDLGFSYSHKRENNKSWGMKFGVGSASDHPFANFDTTTFMLMVYFSRPGKLEGSRWIFTVFMSNNNEIANYVPIPGFVYMYNTPTFTGLFGLPFAAVQWRPSTEWTWSGSILGPAISVEGAYGKIHHTQGFVGYSWSQQSYLPKDRPDQRDRLYYNEMRAFGGVRAFVSNSVSLEVQSGYAFNRSFNEGPNTFSKDVGSTTLANSPFAQLNLKMEL